MCWSLVSISASRLQLDVLLEVAEVDARGEVALGALDRGAEAVLLVERLQDLGLGGDDRQRAPAGDAAVGVEGLEVERIAQRHPQLAVLQRQRDHPVLAREGARDLLLDEVGIERQGVDAHVLHAGVVGEGGGDVALGELAGLAVAAGHLEAHAEDHLVADRPQLVGARGAHALGQQPRLLLDRGGLLGVDQPLALEHFRQQLRADAHGRGSVAEPSPMVGWLNRSQGKGKSAGRVRLFRSQLTRPGGGSRTPGDSSAG